MINWARNYGVLVLMLLTFFLGACKKTLGQHEEISFRHLSTTDGLSNFTVFSIAQDHQGFIWFGTMDGLNRFDGENIKTYREDPDDPFSLGSSYIWSLFCTSDSGLWVGTNRGLYRYDFLHDNFHPIDFKDRNGSEQAIRVRSMLSVDGVLWVGLTSGLVRYDLTSEEYIPFEAESDFKLDIGSVLSMEISENEGVWIGSNLGLFKYTDKLEEIDLDQYSDSRFICRSFLKDGGGRLWIGTDNRDIGLIIYDPQSKETLKLSKKDGILPNNRVRSLFRFQNGDIWAGTRDGMAVINEKTYAYRHLLHDRFNPNSLSHNSIRPIFESREGIIWIGTYSGGVNYFDPRSQLVTHYSDKYRIKNSLNYNVITSIYEDHEGKLWIGTEGRGVNIYDSDKKSYTIIKRDTKGNSLVHNNVKDIIEDDSGRKFIATNNGLSIYDPRDESFFNIMNRLTTRGRLSHPIVHDLCKDANGNIWLGTTGNNGRLQMYDVVLDTIIHYIPSDRRFPNLENVVVNALFYDQTRNMMWSGGDNGLCAFDLKLKRYLTDTAFLRVATGLKEVIINDLLMDENGMLWIATFGRGLYLLDVERFELRKLGVEDGVVEKSFYALEADDKGNVWISVNAHLIKVKPAKNINRSIQRVERYTIQEGFPPQQYYRKSVCKGKDGTLYFGGDNGIVSFDPDKMEKQIFNPEVIVTNILVNGEQYNVRATGENQSLNVAALKSIVLDHSQSSFSIHFIAPNFLNPENTWYQYQLLGINESWQDLGRTNSINFTELRPGKYELKIKASSNPSYFSDPFHSLQIEILPPFWRTPVAYLMYLILILALLYLFFSITRKWERLTQRLKYEHLEREKEQEFHHQRIRFFTDISHELRTPLTLILAPLEKIAFSNFGSARIQNQLMLMLRNGERMLQMINQLLDLRKLETGNMRIQAAKGNIVHFIHEVSLSFRELAQSRNIDFKVKSSQDYIYAWFDRDKFEVILFNLLSNAIKFTPDHGRINIFVGKYKDLGREEENNQDHVNNDFYNSICIEITNSGRGIPGDQIEHIFKRFYSGKSDGVHSKYSSGVGLEIVKKMVDLHKGHISVKSECDEDGVNGFASFSIILKRGKKHFAPDELLKGYKSSEDISSYRKPLQPRPVRQQQDIEEEPEIAEIENKEETILIIEDNPEVRKLVVDVFRERCNILEANNGNDGLDIARNMIPDLIISDIMMPGIDGIELCRKVKTDINTSHIPLILLTARTAVTFKYEGLETGADDYIVKPFSIEDLRLRALNLIRQRRLLKERYGRSGILLPEEITVTSVDEKLLKRTVNYIMDHISDTDMTIEKISLEVGMSRVHFYRKIKALTDLSPAEFLRKIRMEHAGQLLKTNKLNVSEVRYMIGIADADYFRKCFKAHYGVTPKEFQQSHLSSSEAL